MDGEGRSVLVVDDDPTIRELVEVLLVGEGYRVRTAVHGGEALDLLRGWCPDVIVLDMLMPILDGAGFLAARQASPRLRRIPVIVMSASFKLRQAGERSDASALLPKPFRIDELLAHVATLTIEATPAVGGPIPGG
jgi:CheY-like chemotaxis protein